MPERAAELAFGEGMMGETATCQVKRTGIILLFLSALRRSGHRRRRAIPLECSGAGATFP